MVARLVGCWLGVFAKEVPVGVLANDIEIWWKHPLDDSAQLIRALSEMIHRIDVSGNESILDTQIHIVCTSIANISRGKMRKWIIATSRMFSMVAFLLETFPLKYGHGLFMGWLVFPVPASCSIAYDFLLYGKCLFRTIFRRCWFILNVSKWIIIG